MKRAAYVGLVLLAAALGAIALLRREEPADVRLTGIVSANEAFVASELSGRLRELRVDEGDRVEKDQVIAVLATEEIDTQRQGQLAAIAQLSARLEQGEERVRLETARVKSQIEAATAQLRASESQREEILRELEQSLKDLERTSELLAQGLVARQIKEQEETAVEVIRARLQTADDRVQAARAELEIHRASERQVRVMEQEVQQTEAQVAQARAELQQIAVRRGYTELRSPLTGVVSIRVAREGEFVAAGSPVVTVVDLDDVWVRAEVEETLLARLVLGQTLKVVLASDLELSGEVTFISPEAGFATQRDVDRVKRDIRTFGIKVALDNPDGRIHPGMTAFVVVPGEDALSAAAGGRDQAPATRVRQEPSPATERPPVLTGTAVAAPTPARQAESIPSDPAPAASSAKKPSTAPKVDASGQQSAPKNAAAAPERRETGISKAPTAVSSPDKPVASAKVPRAPIPASRMREENDRSSATEMNEGTAADEEAAPTAAGPSSPENPSLEALLENIDMEDPTDADLALLEAALSADTETAEGAEDRRAPVAARRKEPPTPAPPVAAAAAPTAPPDLRLEGISVAEGKPVAVINGSRVFEGDSVSGARVVRIVPDSVVLDFGGRTITLRF